MPGFRMRPALHPVTGALEGFTVHDRYPRDTAEWVNLLAVVVTHAALHPVSVTRPLLFAVLDLSDADSLEAYRDAEPGDRQAGLVHDDEPAGGVGNDVGGAGRRAAAGARPASSG